MSLYVNFFSSSGAPLIPEHLAHEANDEATRAVDVGSSREAYEKTLQEEISHPNHQKFVSAQQSRAILLYYVLALIFFVILAWEYEISRELYEALSPNWPLMPFVGLTGFAFLASACLAEASPMFSVLSLDTEKINNDLSQSMIDRIYDRVSLQRKFSHRSLLLLLGIFIAVVVEVIIYGFSQYRVEQLTMAGEVPEAASHIVLFLPVLLYGTDILLGIPTFYVAFWWYDRRRIRKLLRDRTVLRDQELLVRESALRKYMDYIVRLGEYNAWAVQQSKPTKASVPPSKELKNWFDDRFGYDPTSRGEPSVSVPGSVHDKTSSSVEDRPHGDKGAAREQQGTDDQRIEDLVNLLNEQTDKANRSL